MTGTTLAARVHEFGAPPEVIRIDEIPLAGPGEGEVLVRMRYAPINPADLNILEGRYGKLPALPGRLGNEGVGRVVAAGPGVVSVGGGDLVIPRGGGCWSRELVVPESHLVRLPRDLDERQASMLLVNPCTAWLMLHEFVPPEPGAWVVQNAANSSVGRAVIQIARSLGLRTLNVVRREELVAPLLALGADAVVLDGADLRERADSICGGVRPLLALNAVGGASALGIANALADGGTHVTYGAMGKQPLKIPNGLLIFRDLRFVGFWLTRHQAHLSGERGRRLFDGLAALVRAGHLHTPVEAVYPLARAPEAVAHAMRERRAGKVLLEF